MANRVPLILNTSSNQIQELPTGDNLDLSNSGIHNAGVITATTFNGSFTGTFSGDGSNLSNLSLAQATVGYANSSGISTVAQGLTGSPDITVGAISAQNISIGGTLTYEDVTNVDSVGVITARSGVNVTDGNVFIGQGGSGANNAELKLQAGAGTGNDIIAFLNQAGSTRGNLTYDTDNNFLLFNVNASERLRIKSDGALNLTTSNASLEWTASSGSNPFIRSIGSGQQSLEFNTGGSERLRITSGGQLIAGSTSADTSALISIIKDTTEVLADNEPLYNNASPAFLTVYNSNNTGSGEEAGINIVPAGSANGAISIYGKKTGSYAGDLIFRFRSGASTSAERLRITSDGKIGVGIASPVGTFEIRDSKANLIVAKDGLTAISNSDAHTTYDLIQLGAGGGLASYSTATATADTHLVHNAYRHSGGSWKYKYADTAMRLRMNSPGGAFIFDSAASGSAGGTISFTERLRIAGHGGVIFKGGPLQEKVKITAGKLSSFPNIDLADGNVHYFTTQESTTSTPNLRVNSSISLDGVMAIGETVAVTLITTAAAGGYSAALQIHGNTQTVNWVGGSTPSSGGSSGVDIYNYTIIKTGSSAFTVIGNLTKTS